jgi:hypothetical protein
MSVTDVTNVACFRKAITMSDLLCDGCYSDLATINVKIFSEWKRRGTAASFSLISCSRAAIGRDNLSSRAFDSNLWLILAFSLGPLGFFETI